MPKIIRFYPLTGFALTQYKYVEFINNVGTIYYINGTSKLSNEKIQDYVTHLVNTGYWKMEVVNVTPYDYHEALELHKDIWKDKHFERLVDQAIEECAELQFALLKHRRGKGDINNILEEYCDIIINLKAILKNLGISKSKKKEMMQLKVNKFLIKVKELKNASDRTIY